MLGLNGMVNISELLINIVMTNESKMLIDSYTGGYFPCAVGIHGQSSLSVKRQNLTHSVT